MPDDSIKPESATGEITSKPCPYQSPYQRALETVLTAIRHAQAQGKKVRVIAVDIDETVLHFNPVTSQTELMYASTWKRRFAKEKKQNAEAGFETIFCYCTARIFYGGVVAARPGLIPEQAIFYQEIAMILSQYQDYIPAKHLIAVGGLGTEVVNYGSEHSPCYAPEPGCKTETTLQAFINAGLNPGDITLFDDNDEVIDAAKTAGIRAIRIPSREELRDNPAAITEAISGISLREAFYSVPAGPPAERLSNEEAAEQLCRLSRFGFVLDQVPRR